MRALHAGNMVSGDRHPACAGGVGSPEIGRWPHAGHRYRDRFDHRARGCRGKEAAGGVPELRHPVHREDAARDPSRRAAGRPRQGIAAVRHPLVQAWPPVGGRRRGRPGVDAAVATDAAAGPAATGAVAASAAANAGDAAANPATRPAEGAGGRHEGAGRHNQGRCRRTTGAGEGSD